MKILAVAGDLFFRAKLEAMARRAGAELTLIKSAEELAAAKELSFDAGVVDLEGRVFDLDYLLLELKAGWPGMDVWGFAAHGNAELMDGARRAGCRVVLSRGAFDAKFPRYLAGEELR